MQVGKIDHELAQLGRLIEHWLRSVLNRRDGAVVRASTL